MSDIDDPVLQRAPIRRTRKLSIIWAIPVIAVLIGGWLAWDTLSRQGPTIVVSFMDAEGLAIGQSQLKFKDITLGTVRSLEFTPDHRRVLVAIATTSQARPLVTDGAAFWVVKPRLFAGNLSGLSTLLSGAYVGMTPGTTGANQVSSFVGREEPPVLESDIPGRTFLLKTDQLRSVTLGSPIFYRGLSVGQVLGWDIGDMAESVTIHAFVREPFDSYVRDETRFWNASGVSVKLGGAGVELQVESLRALLLGGIGFETPSEGRASKVSTADHLFPLFDSQDAAKAASYQRRIPALTYFSGSVRGLVVGSDVVMHGLKVGQVTDVRLTYDPESDTVLAPVHYQVEPERVLGVGQKLADDTPDRVRGMVKRGLRATLQTSNILTGEMIVSLEVIPDAPPGEVTERDGSFVIPSAESGGLSSLQTSAAELLRNVNAIPFASIGRNLDQITASMSGPELKDALASLNGIMADARMIVQSLNNDMRPVLRQLPEVVSQLQVTLRQTNVMMKSVESGYGENTQFHRDLDRLMGQMTEAVRSFRALADLLARHPEALVRGRPAGGTE